LQHGARRIDDFRLRCGTALGEVADLIERMRDSLGTTSSNARIMIRVRMLTLGFGALVAVAGLSFVVSIAVPTRAVGVTDKREDRLGRIAKI
jgi:hypothetical protein